MTKRTSLLHSNPLTLLSPAKLNLGLRVGRRRADGFHDITTILVRLALHDTITIARTSPGIRVTCNRCGVPASRLASGVDPAEQMLPDRSNLCYKAAAAFFSATGIGTGCRIRVHKRIPIGGGLGGGSSNAATVLLGLNRLFGLPLPVRRLVAIGATLGSDVPFFLSSGACVAKGRGERLDPIKLPRLHVLLHCPGYGVSTVWAYRALDRAALTSPGLSPKILTAALRRRELDKVAAQVRNDFEPVVFPKHPDLRRAKEELLAHGAYAAALSGSGSTVYGLVPARGWKDPMAALVRLGLPCIHTQTT